MFSSADPCYSQADLIRSSDKTKIGELYAPIGIDASLFSRFAKTAFYDYLNPKIIS
jgi:hypothetical protein